MHVSSRSSLVYLAIPQRFVIGDCGVPSRRCCAGASAAGASRLVAAACGASAPMARGSHGKKAAMDPLIKKFRRFIFHLSRPAVWVRQQSMPRILHLSTEKNIFAGPLVRAAAIITNATPVPHASTSCDRRIHDA